MGNNQLSVNKTTVVKNGNSTQATTVTTNSSTTTVPTSIFCQVNDKYPEWCQQGEKMFTPGLSATEAGGVLSGNTTPYTTEAGCAGNYLIAGLLYGFDQLFGNINQTNTQVTTTNSSNGNNAAFSVDNSGPDKSKAKVTVKSADVNKGKVTLDCTELKLTNPDDGKKMTHEKDEQDMKYIVKKYTVQQRLDQYNTAYKQLADMKDNDPKRAKQEARVANLYIRLEKLLKQNKVGTQPVDSKEKGLSLNIPVNLEAEKIGKKDAHNIKMLKLRINYILHNFKIEKDKTNEIDKNRSISCRITELRRLQIELKDAEAKLKSDKKTK